MKTNLLLKNLIDALFILMIPGILGFLIILPFGIFSTTISNVNIDGYDDFKNLSVLYWCAVALSMLSYTFMLIALYFLKKSAKYFLNNDLLKQQVIDNLHKSGAYLIITSIFVIVSYLLLWISSMDGDSVSLQYGTNIFAPMFIAIVGLFFKLTSNTLQNMVMIKAENDLTI